MNPSLRVALIYLVLGVIWIFGSDTVLSFFIASSPEFQKAQSFKGWFFVGVSSIIIYILLIREFNKQTKASRERYESEQLYQNILKRIKESVIVFNINNWKIELLSEQTSTFFEIPHNDIIANPIVLSERLHPIDRELVIDIWQNRMKENLEGLTYRLIMPDGRVKWAFENRLYINDLENKVERAIAITTDITDYMTKQELLEKSVKENGTLLTEVHHRVKNNLAVIISFLQLQSYSASHESAEILEQSIARIKAIALVHEKLYSSSNLSRIDAREYVHSLVDNIKLMYMRDDVSVMLDIDEKEMDIAMSIPFGLMITEMLTNSFRHAFPSINAPMIKIILRNHSNLAWEFSYEDNGKGFPEGFNFRETTSIGMSVIFSLCSQLSGREKKVISEPGKGIYYLFEFLPKK